MTYLTIAPADLDGRVHGSPKMLPVFSGLVPRAVNTARGAREYLRTEHPCSRAVLAKSKA